MAEVLRVFNDPILLGDVPYRAQVCGRSNGHIWEGWVEFAAEDGSSVRRTQRETTQPDRDALIYWTQGLSGTYLEGALARTRTTTLVDVVQQAEPYFDGPAPSKIVQHRVEVLPPVEASRPVLDPFSVGAKGEELLRSELGALREWHLRNIIRGYDLADPSLDLEQLQDDELIDLIVAAVQPA